DRGKRPIQDVYLVLTTNAEIGGGGGAYASATLPGTLPIALEVGPTEREYATTVTGGPIIGYSDALCVYDKDVADQLMHIAIDRGLTPQPATLGAFMSDASHSKASGLTPRAGLLCLPTLSTHAFEVIPRAAIDDMAGIVADFLSQPMGRYDGPAGGGSTSCGWREFVVEGRLQCGAECVFGVNDFGEPCLAKLDGADKGAGPFRCAVGKRKVGVLVTVTDQLAQTQRAKAVLGEDAI